MNLVLKCQNLKQKDHEVFLKVLEKVVARRYDLALFLDIRKKKSYLDRYYYVVLEHNQNVMKSAETVI